MALLIFAAAYSYVGEIEFKIQTGIKQYFLGDLPVVVIVVAVGRRTVVCYNEVKFSFRFAEAAGLEIKPYCRDISWIGYPDFSSLIFMLV